VRSRGEEPVQDQGNERLTLTIPEVAKLLRIGRNTAYQAARNGSLPGVLRFGRTIRISIFALDQFLKEQHTDEHKV